MRVLVLVLLSVLAQASPVGAVQRDVEQVFPGRVLIGVQPLGVQADSSGKNRYKLDFDIAVLLGHGSRIGVWLGAGFDYAGGPNYDLQPWLFLSLSFERFLRIPLVPSVRFGPGSQIYYDSNGLYDSVAVGLRFEFAMHYYVTRHVGIGFQSGVAAGAVIRRDDPRDPLTALHGSPYAWWDLGVGVRFAF